MSNVTYPDTHPRQAKYRVPVGTKYYAISTDMNGEYSRTYGSFTVMKECIFTEDDWPTAEELMAISLPHNFIGTYVFKIPSNDRDFCFIIVSSNHVDKMYR
jgi:hypothetical protein